LSVLVRLSILPRRRRMRQRRGCWIAEKPPWLPPMSGRETVFVPVSNDSSTASEKEPVILYPEEVEAYRLVYLEGRTQEEAAKLMGVSRGALWRLLYSARRKIGLAIVQRRPLIVFS